MPKPAADKSAKAPWRQRKEASIRKLASVDYDVALVTVADKLHNLTAMIRDVGKAGSATMARFNAPADQIIWYHRAVAEALGRYRGAAPIEELDATIQELADLLA